MVSGRAIFSQICQQLLECLYVTDSLQTLIAPAQACFLSGLGTACFVCHSDQLFFGLNYN
jgi:FMN phosphatase YigB (HAD superfamily)